MFPGAAWACQQRIADPCMSWLNASLGRARNKITRERQAIVRKSIKLGLTPLGYMLWIMRNKNVRKERRDAIEGRR
jgi:hypothetical protein